MEPLSGLGKADRQRLSRLLRGTKGTLSVSDAAGTLDLPRNTAAKLLARWAAKGWLSRVRRGLYVPVPLESGTADVPLEDAWPVAARMFERCYIGGWSAAEYWDLTEQIFRTVVVLTTQRPRKRRQRIKGTDFLLRTIHESAMFGLDSVWRGQTQVNVSNPARTVLDLLNDPALAGGSRPLTDMFCAWLASGQCDLPLLLEYGDKLGNGAVFKRLGFLLERYAPDESVALSGCLERLTAGTAKLDTALPCKKLVTRWRLWIPEAFMKNRAGEKSVKIVDDKLQIGSGLVVSRSDLAALSKRFHIKRLSLFGSAARGELTPSSDIDLLVEFEPNEAPSLAGMVKTGNAFSMLFGGRKVDVATRSILNNPYRRREIEKDMEVLYAA